MYFDLGSKEVTDLVNEYITCSDVKKKKILKQKVGKGFAWIDISPKKMYKWPISTWKYAQYH